MGNDEKCVASIMEQLEHELSGIISDLFHCGPRDDQIKKLYGYMPISYGLELILQDVLSPEEIIREICRTKIKGTTTHVDAFCKFILCGDKVFPSLAHEHKEFKIMLERERQRILNFC